MSKSATLKLIDWHNKNVHSVAYYNWSGADYAYPIFNSSYREVNTSSYVYGMRTSKFSNSTPSASHWLIPDWSTFESLCFLMSVYEEPGRRSSFYAF